MTCSATTSSSGCCWRSAAALFVGNLMALLRPPPVPKDDEDLTVAPRSRSILMAGLGLVVAVAALGGLLK